MIHNKMIIFSDLHKYGVKPIDVALEYGSRVVHLNDNWDFVNCKLESYGSMMTRYTNHIDRAKSSLTIEVRSNHGGIAETYLPYYRSMNGVLYTHGHFLWSDKKIRKWEQKGPCSGSRWKARITNWLRDRIPKKKLSKKQIRKAHDMATGFDCHTIVFGHTHIKNTVDIKYKGVRIINVSQGRNEIYV